jgi:prolyl-tRNA editing enzyme YbaK/EbsC (Cys-tRNA(Pro) deacylase)
LIVVQLAPDELASSTCDGRVRLRPGGYISGVSATWPEPVERVAAFLRDAGAEARIEELRGDTETAEGAARAAGTTLERIVKTLVFICDGAPVVALVPGDRRADLDKVARAAAGVEARIARRAEVEEATGFAPGAVAPFPLPSIETVLIDPSLLGHDTVWVGAGSPTHLAALGAADLARLSRARPMDVVQDPAYHASAKGEG